MVQSSSSLMSGVPELMVLRLLLEREMYGYEIAKAIREVTREGIAIGESVLYPALHVLETRGLLKARRRTVEGRERVYYAVTSKGRKRLEHLTKDWRRICAGVEAVLGGARHA